MIHFGTVQKIKSASMDELKKIKTIPLKKLEEIYEFFNGLQVKLNLKKYL